MSTFKMQRWATAFALGSLALLVAGCGGSDATPPKASISKVYVMGDSLADVGTFGKKFTIQKNGDAAGYPIWPQLVANAFGLSGSSQCNFYVSVPQGPMDGNTFSENSAAGCTNFAIGNGVITNAPTGAANPKTINTQMAKKIAAIGNYSSTDLVLIDGGGNDAKDLVSAYLGLSYTNGVSNYISFLTGNSILDLTTVNTLLPQTNGPALAAGAYMQQLAITFYGQIKAQTLDKGATHVAVLNMPDITLTPRFQAVLAGVALAQGSATSQALQAAIRQWIGAYNAQLKTSIGSDTRVALVDFYTDFSDEVSNPSSYSLTNVTTAACPVVGADSTTGLPTYDFPTCSDTALDATSGKTAGWWKTYAFSDGFHPTPYGHQLLSASVSRALARAGWL